MHNGPKSFLAAQRAFSTQLPPLEAIQQPRASFEPSTDNSPDVEARQRLRLSHCFSPSSSGTKLDTNLSDRRRCSASATWEEAYDEFLVSFSPLCVCTTKVLHPSLQASVSGGPSAISKGLMLHQRTRKHIQHPQTAFPNALGKIAETKAMLSGKRLAVFLDYDGKIAFEEESSRFPAPAPSTLCTHVVPP